MDLKNFPPQKDPIFKKQKSFSQSFPTETKRLPGKKTVDNQVFIHFRIAQRLEGIHLVEKLLTRGIMKIFTKKTI